MQGNPEHPHSSLNYTGLVKCKCIYHRKCSFQRCLGTDSFSLPLWLLAVSLMSYTRNLNFLGRYLGYLESVSQPFCVLLVLVVTAQIVNKKLNIFQRISFFDTILGNFIPWEMFLIWFSCWCFFFFNSFSEIIVLKFSISQMRQLKISACTL